MGSQLCLHYSHFSDSESSSWTMLKLHLKKKKNKNPQQYDPLAKMILVQKSRIIL